MRPPNSLLHNSCHVGLILGGLMLATLLPFPGFMSSAARQDTPLSLDQWSSNGPDGGPVLSVAIDYSNPSTTYAGAGGGVFKSTNGGGSWSQSLSPDYNSSTYALEIDPTNSNIIYATAASGLMKSTDGGASWSHLSAGGGAYSLAIDPKTPTILYTGFSVVSKSTDGGVHWTTLNTGSFNQDLNGNTYVITLAIDPSNSNVIYAAGGQRIIKSRDGGTSWSEAFNSSRVATFSALAIDPVNSNTIYAGGYAYDCCGGVVLKSTDVGTTWSRSNLSGSVSTFAIDPFNPNIIYAGGNGVFKSTNGGQSWNASNGGLAFFGAQALAIDPVNPATIYAAGNGIFKSTNGGASWTATNSGLRGGVGATAVAINPRPASAVYTETNSGLFKSADNGGSWTPSDFYPLAVDPGNSSTIYSTRVTGRNGLLKSTDGGATWAGIGLTSFFNGTRYVTALGIDPHNSAVIYAALGGTDGGVFKSVDGGESWNQSSTVPDGIYTLAIDARDPRTIYAGGSTLFKSADSGATWSALSDLFGVRLIAIDPHDSQTLYSVAYDAFPSESHAAYKSTDGGLHWNVIFAGISSLVIDPTNSHTIYATVGSGVSKSTDGGASWNSFSNGLTSGNVFALAIDASGTFLHAGTQAGVFDIQLSPAAASPTPTPSVSPTATPLPTPSPPASPSWSITGNLNTGRDGHSATLLPDGKVLVAAGSGGNTSELYDPATGVFSHTGNLNSGHALHTATLLPNGKVLVAAGFSNNAELYDPTTATWSITGNLNTGRFSHTATLLPNGKVLVAGGFFMGVALNSAELYDPATGTWSYTGNLNSARTQHTATLLPNGKVLVAAGGYGDCSTGLCSGNLTSTELYDPSTGTWSNTSNLNAARAYHTASLLPNGKFLVAGGYYCISGSTNCFGLNTAELYDPATEVWTSTGSLNASSVFLRATLLLNGKVLIVGQGNAAELYDPAAETWSNTTNLNNGRSYPTATLLLNGKVLITGGQGALNSAELYDPGGNPNDDAQTFVRQQYLDFLNREPDAGGLAYWTSRITECGSDARCIHHRRLGVSAAFFIELEFQDTGYYVYRFYKASFGRQPNFTEFTTDRNRVVAGSNLEASKQAFADEWVQRPAFLNAYPNTMSNTEVVNKLFDSAGLAASIYDPQRQQEIGAMNAGRSRALVLRDVIEISDFKSIPDPNGPRYAEIKQVSQYNPAFVLMQYFGYLRRDVDRAGYDFWIDVLDNRESNNYLAMVCAFITSREYQLRFGPVVTRSNADCGQ